MAYYATADDLYGVMGQVFVEAMADPEIGPTLRASGVVLRLDLTEPVSVMTVDLPGHRLFTGDPPDAPHADIRLRAKADVAHRFWLGEVNVALAISRGQIRVRGSVPTLIELAGLAKALFPRYQAVIAAREAADAPASAFSSEGRPSP